MITDAPQHPTLLSGLRCGICGSSRATTLLRGVAAVARCEGCGVGYTTIPPPPGADDLFDGRVYRGYFERAEQWRYEARRRLRWLLETAHPRRLLEIGSAGGFFIETARQAGIDALGVELSPTAASYARDTLGVPVHTGPFEEFTSSQRFDAICAFHVLEHVVEPTVFLRRAVERLDHGGILAIEVPNIASARAHRTGSSWAGLQVDRHRWHFSPAALRTVVERAGLAVQRLDTVSPRFYMRRRTMLTRAALALLGQDLIATGSLRTMQQSNHGDYLRLIAVKQ